MALRSTTATRLSCLFFTALLGVGGLACGCSSTSQPASGEILADLGHRDPRILIRVLRSTVDSTSALNPSGRRLVMREIVRALEHDDGAVRFYAAIALRRITGQEYGFEAHAGDLDRARAIDRWLEALEFKDEDAVGTTETAGASEQRATDPSNTSGDDA